MINHDDDDQQPFNKPPYAYHPHQHHYYGLPPGHSPHEAMSTTTTPTPFESPSHYGAPRIREDVKFHDAFPQARHAPTYSARPYYNPAPFVQSDNYTGVHNNNLGSWTGFVSPYPDYRISANAAALSSAKPVALFYDRREEDGPVSVPTQFSRRDVPQTGHDDSRMTSNISLPLERHSNQISSTGLPPVIPPTPDSASPSAAPKAASRHRTAVGQDTESPTTPSFLHTGIQVSTDQAQSPISQASDASFRMPTESSDVHAPSQDHGERKIKIEQGLHEVIPSALPGTDRSNQPAVNLYPQPGVFTTPRGIPLVPLTSSSKRSMSKKPPLACHFCRGRKIACGPPDPNDPNKTCNQCQRRKLVCEYPTESRRGLRKKKSPVLNAAGTKVKVKKSKAC